MHSLDVKWSTGTPESTVTSWHSWPANLSFPEQPLDSMLLLPGGTSQALEKAFSLGLNRKTGWDTSGVENPAALLAAAKIFKRGVAAKSTAPENAQPEPSNGSYKIDFYDQLSDLLRILKSYSAAFICDEGIKNHYPDLGMFADLQFLKTSEQKKSLEQVASLLNNKFLQIRDTWIVIGGGILSDIVGFAAYLAKKKFYVVPTTLLAMADASVGGKTGVNAPPFGKNQIGAFNFPQGVFVSLEWLRTLPDREFHAGLSECVKHAILLGDAALLEELKIAAKTKYLSSAQLAKIIALKVNVVNADPTEQSIRAILNLGHTLAHGLEAVSQVASKNDGNITIHHGEAVAIGILYATLVSQEVAGLSEDNVHIIHSALTSTNCIHKKICLEKMLGADLGDKNLWDSIYKAMLHDKKGAGEAGIEFVLISDLGRVFQSPTGAFTTPVPKKTLDAAWTKLLSLLSDLH